MKQISIPKNKNGLSNQRKGSVSFGHWHNRKVGFKRLKLEKQESTDLLRETVMQSKNTRQEFETTLKLRHPNIMKVYHIFRYQETKKVDEERHCSNWTVIVMEKHLKNIGELTGPERIFLPKLMLESLGCCLN